MKKVIHTTASATPTAGNSFAISSINTINFRSNTVIKKIYTYVLLVDTAGAYKQFNRYSLAVGGSGLQQYQIPGNGSITNNPRAYFNENTSPCWHVNFIYNVGSSFSLLLTIYATLLATDSITVYHTIEWDFFNE